MLKAIPWDIIGQVSAAVIIILSIVFGFILKFQKGTKNLTPTNPPIDINATSKKTLCFRHEGDIAANKTAIGIFGAALQEANRENSKQHGKLFDKCEELGNKISETSADIIKEIHKANGDG